NDIVDKYPVIINGEPVRVKPHDLRRTYAKLMHDIGTNVLAIADNMGHTNNAITHQYIGQQDMEQRRPSKSILA
ncbi:MAG: tyrosine-type recombinase/integrase, partial [Planctomycetes bacterium]|nr:tyrosine-type recombinase/integrase [Planctomycetota bacterium]